MITSIIPELIVKDINTNIAFFVDNFNFSVKQKEIIDGNVKFAELTNGGNSLYLQAIEFTKSEFVDFNTKLYSSNLILFHCKTKDDFKGIYHRIKNNNVAIFSDLKETDYGTEEFVILTPEKYMIEIWRKI